MDPIKRRKKFNDCTEQYKNRLVNEKFEKEFAEQIALLDKPSENIAETNNEKNLNPDVTNSAMEALQKMEQSNKINDEKKTLNDESLLDNDLNENKKTNEIEDYLHDKIYEELCESLDSNLEKVYFEGQKYSYSDSSDSENDVEVEENDFDLAEELKDIGLQINNREITNNLLKILQKAGHNELPNNAEKLLNTPKQTIITSCQSGEYMHYGLIKALEDFVRRKVILPYVLEIDVGIDGLPLSKSTNRKLWPITGRIRNSTRLPPFLVGAYHGFHSPTSSLPFLKPFVDEYEELENKEIIIGLSRHKMKLRNVICDTPGRCMVSATKGYDGYQGCCRCVITGAWRGKIVFLHENSELRTDESFRKRKTPGHHKGLSAFEILDVNMILLFALD